MAQPSFHTIDLSKHSFLVTGGSGFIGSNIVEYLIHHKAGKVRVIDNLSTCKIDNIKPFLSLPNFEFLDKDITDFDNCEKACKGIEFVLHQAALGSVPRSIKYPLATHANNATGFLNIINAARLEGVKRFVYASSSSVYGDSAVLPKREGEIGNPLSPYAVSKLTNELYARVFANVYNMPIIGLRYFNVFGPNQSPDGMYAAVIPLFMEALMKNKAPLIDGDGEQTRDFTYVENAVQANIKALFTDNKEALNNVYNVAVGERVTINQLFNIIAELTGSGTLPVHRESRAGDIRNSLADISKAKKLLGYNPQVLVKEGLTTTMKWFKETIN